MSAPIAGFICALVLAVLVIVWIAFCMFCRERHKSEKHHYDISDLQHRNYQLAQELEAAESAKEKTVTTGIFILPSRRMQKDDSYDKRPDYPESPAPMLQAGNDELIEIFNDGIADYEETSAKYQSDV